MHGNSRLAYLAGCGAEYKKEETKLRAAVAVSFSSFLLLIPAANHSAASLRRTLVRFFIN